MNPTEDLFPARGIFISAKGAQTSQHIDPWCSDAILCQVQGYKKVTLYDPSQKDLFNEIINNPKSNENNFSLTYIDFLYPKEVLFIPHSWPHFVDTLEDSVSVTWNFIHTSTVRDFIQYLISSPPKEEMEVIEYFIRKTKIV